MELSNTITTLLAKIEQPAFCVQNGIVTGANEAAEHRQILRSTDARGYLATLDCPADGACTVNAAGTTYQAAVSKIGDTMLVILEADNTNTQLQSLALAAQHFRSPLGNITALVDMLLHSDPIRENPDVLSQALRLSRGLTQIQRMICDMSDTWQYANWQNIHKTTVDISSVFYEIIEKASSALSQANIALNYSGPDQPVYCLADAQMLERAIYNLISNSVKFSEGVCAIEAKLTVCGNMLHFSVADTGKSMPCSLRGAVFSRFLKAPGVEDGIFGISLGMMLIRSVAAAHGGTILIDHPQENSNRVTMTMEIATDHTGKLSNPLRSSDYAGGRDHALLELSDILPPEMYDCKKY